MLKSVGGAALGAVGIGAEKGISVDAQIGDRANDVQAGGTKGAGDITAKDSATVNVNTTQADAQVESAGVVNVKNYDPWMLGLLLLVVTLFVPSPLGLLKRIPLWRRVTSQRQSTKASGQKSQ